MHATPEKNCGGITDGESSTLLIGDHTFPFHDSASGMSYPTATHAIRETQETPHTAAAALRPASSEGCPMIVHARPFQCSISAPVWPYPPAMHHVEETQSTASRVTISVTDVFGLGP